MPSEGFLETLQSSHENVLTSSLKHDFLVSPVVTNQQPLRRWVSHSIKTQNDLKISSSTSSTHDTVYRKLSNDENSSLKHNSFNLSSGFQHSESIYRTNNRSENIARIEKELIFLVKHNCLNQKKKHSNPFCNSSSFNQCFDVHHNDDDDDDIHFFNNYDSLSYQPGSSADLLILQGKDLLAYDPHDKDIIKLLAALHLYKGNTISALRYINILDTHDMSIPSIGRCCYTSTDIAEFNATLNFYLLALRTIEHIETDAYKEALSCARIALKIGPDSCHIECPLKFSKTTADFLLRHELYDEALQLYEQIITLHTTTMAQRDTTTTLSTMTTIAASETSVSTTTATLHDTLDIPSFNIDSMDDNNNRNNNLNISTKIWPSLFGTSGWIPEPLKKVLDFSKKDFIDVVMIAARLRVYRQQYMTAINHLRTAYALQPTHAGILLQLADLGFLQNVEDFEDFYIELLQELLPASIIASIDGFTKYFNKSLNNNTTSSELKHNEFLLLECLLALSRNHLRRKDASTAKSILTFVAQLINFNTNAFIISEGQSTTLNHQLYNYKSANNNCNNNTLNDDNTNTIRIPCSEVSIDVKCLFLRLMLKCLLELKDYHTLVTYGYAYISLSPPNPDSSLLLTEALIQIGNLSEAKLHLKVALEQCRNNTTCNNDNIISSKCEEKSNSIYIDTKRIFKNHLFSLIFDKKSFVWKPFLINLSITSRSQEASIAEKLLKIAERDSINDFETQQSCLEFLSSLDIRNTDLKYKLAFALEQQKKFSEAKAFYMKVLKLEPRHSEACLRLGQLYIKEQDYNNAYDILKRIEDSSKSNLVFLELLAIAALNNQPQRLEDALQAWRTAIELEPNFVRGLYTLGLLYYRNLKDFSNAKIYMERVLNNVKSQQNKERVASIKENGGMSELKTLELWAGLILAEIFFFEGNYNECSNALEKMSIMSYDTKTEEGVRILLLSSRIDMIHGKFSKVLKTLQPILTTRNGTSTLFSTEISELYVVGAQAAELLEQYDDSKVFAMQAYNLNPQSALCLSTLAWVLAQKPNSSLDESLRLCTVAEGLNSFSPLPTIFKGCFFMIQQEMNKAKECIQIAHKKFLYVWSHHISARCHCPKSVGHMCRFYHLLYWHLSTWPSILSYNEEELMFESTIKQLGTPSLEEFNIFEEIWKDLRIIQSLRQTCMKLLFTQKIDEAWKNFKKIIKDSRNDLKPFIILHHSHWELIPSLLCRLIYAQCKDEQLYKPFVIKASSVSAMPYQQHYKIFRTGEYITSFPMTDDCSLNQPVYKPHPTAFIPIPNDPLLSHRSSKTVSSKNETPQSKPLHYYTALPPNTVGDDYTYKIIQPSHIEVINPRKYNNEEKNGQLTIQSLSSNISQNVSDPLHQKKPSVLFSTNHHHSLTRPLKTSNVRFDHSQLAVSPLSTGQSIPVSTIIPPPSNYVPLTINPFYPNPHQVSLNPYASSLLPPDSKISKNNNEKKLINPPSILSTPSKNKPSPITLVQHHDVNWNSLTNRHSKVQSFSKSVVTSTSSLGVPPDKIFRIQDIRLKKRLGQGGFGIVYSGILKVTGESIAIKKLHSNQSSLKKTEWYDVLSEIQAVFYLRHPTLIQFVGLCIDQENIYILTELCNKGSLYHNLHIQKNSALPTVWDTRHKMALQVIQGVAFLHNLKPKVIHRDLKSLNVVIDDCWNAKICDFGLTTSMDNIKTHISLTKKAKGGSPRYMAPECYQAHNKVTEKVDIWSLGCILIEIFGGSLPYVECKTIEQIMKKLLIDKQTPIIPKHFPLALSTVLNACFEFDSALRWDANKIYNHILYLKPFQIIPYTHQI